MFYVQMLCVATLLYDFMYLMSS